MTNTIRIKRRAAGGLAGAPASLENAELAFNEQDNVLYYGKGAGGTNGTATQVIAIGGPGAFLGLTATAEASKKLFTARSINGVSFDGTSDITVADSTKLPLAGGTMTGNISFAGSQVWPTFNQSTTGNAATATKLATARTINGVSFDGTSNITINAVDSTARVASSEKGAANGVATLGADGKVPAAQLPSYVDDVLEYTNQAAFPASGSTSLIYVALDTNKIYRWGGSAYIEISVGGGTADSAIKLTTARTINGVSFDGTSDITVADSTKLPLAGGTMTGNISFAGSQVWPTFNQSTTGNAATATKLATARTISASGDISWTSTSFDGSANVTGVATLTNSGVTAGTYKSVTVDAKGRVTTGTNPTTLSGYGITDAIGIDSVIDGGTF